MFRNCLLLVCIFILSGCIGSYIVHDDASGHDYDSLITVPERPQAPDLQIYQQDIARLEKDHKQAFKKREVLKTLHKSARPIDP